MEIQAPTLLVMGAEDWVFLDAAKDYASTQTYAELKIMTACGHVCHLDDPLLFNDILFKFLTRHYLTESAGRSAMGFK